jgi:hypothetical protein
MLKSPILIQEICEGRIFFREKIKNVLKYKKNDNIHFQFNFLWLMQKLLKYQYFFKNNVACGNTDIILGKGQNYENQNVENQKELRKLRR